MPAGPSSRIASYARCSASTTTPSRSRSNIFSTSTSSTNFSNDAVRPPSSQPAACSTRSEPEWYVAQSAIAVSYADCASTALPRAEPAAAAVRQPVVARQLAAGERREHALRHAQRRAAGAHVDAGEERAVEARRARPHQLRDRDARQRLGDLQRQAGGQRHRRGRARQHERRHRHRLPGLGPRDDALHHQRVPDQRAVGVHDADDRRRRGDRLAAAARDRRHRTASAAFSPAVP